MKAEDNFEMELNRWKQMKLTAQEDPLGVYYNVHRDTCKHRI